MPVAMTGCSRPLLIESSEDLPESRIERGIQEAESDSAQSDVREHGVGMEVVSENRADHEAGGHRGHLPHTQWAVRETGKRLGELMEPDRIAVHEEIAAAGFTLFREMYQRTGTVLNVNRRQPRSCLPKQQHAAASQDRLDDAFAEPATVAVDPSGECGDDRLPGS